MASRNFLYRSSVPGVGRRLVRGCGLEEPGGGGVDLGATAGICRNNCGRLFDAAGVEISGIASCAHSLPFEGFCGGNSSSLSTLPVVLNGGVIEVILLTRGDVEGSTG